MTLTPLVDARGVAGAVSGNSGGAGILTGKGNRDLRFDSLFLLGNLKMVECDVSKGRLFVASWTWSFELASDRDESDSLPPSAVCDPAFECPFSGVASRARDTERRAGSSWLGRASINPPKLGRACSALRLCSDDFRGDESMLGSKDRRRLKVGNFVFFLGGGFGGGSMVGAVVMIAGAAKGRELAW